MPATLPPGARRVRWGSLATLPPGGGTETRMLGFAWLALRQAQEALRTGRLEEAHRLLNQSAAQGHRRTGELLVGLARGYVARGERRLKHDDAEGAWRDLLQAEQLQTGV